MGSVLDETLGRGKSFRYWRDQAPYSSDSTIREIIAEIFPSIFSAPMREDAEIPKGADINKWYDSLGEEAVQRIQRLIEIIDKGNARTPEDKEFIDEKILPILDKKIHLNESLYKRRGRNVEQITKEKKAMEEMAANEGWNATFEAVISGDKNLEQEIQNARVTGDDIENTQINLVNNRMNVSNLVAFLKRVRQGIAFDKTKDMDGNVL